MVRIWTKAKHINTKCHIFFFLPGHSLIFACLVTQYGTSLRHSAHLLLITSCHYLSLSLPCTCGHIVLCLYMQDFKTLTFGLISQCQHSLLLTSQLYFPSKCHCLFVPDLELCLCEFFRSLPACACGCLAFCSTALKCDLCSLTCELWCFTVSNLVITSTTLFPVHLFYKPPVCPSICQIWNKDHYKLFLQSTFLKDFRDEDPQQVKTLQKIDSVIVWPLAVT